MSFCPGPGVSNSRHVAFTWHIATFIPSLKQGGCDQHVTHLTHGLQVWHSCPGPVLFLIQPLYWKYYLLSNSPPYLGMQLADVVPPLWQIKKLRERREIYKIRRFSLCGISWALYRMVENTQTTKIHSFRSVKYLHTKFSLSKFSKTSNMGF